MHMLQNKREIDDSFSALVKAVMFVFSEMFNLNSFESLHGESRFPNYMFMPVYENSIPKEEGCCCCCFYLCDLSKCLLFLFGICYLQTTVIILTMNKNCLYVYK